MTGRFVCRFCLVPIEPCPDADQHGDYCYGWVHQNNKTHKGHPANPHSAQPVVA